MTVFHVVTLVEGTPQLVVPGAGDTYELIRNTQVTGSLTVTEAVNGIELTYADTENSFFIGDTLGRSTHIGNSRGSTRLINIGLNNADVYADWTTDSVIIGYDNAVVGSNYGDVARSIIIGHDNAEAAGWYNGVCIGVNNAIVPDNSADENVVIGFQNLGITGVGMYVDYSTVIGTHIMEDNETSVGDSILMGYFTLSNLISAVDGCTILTTGGSSPNTLQTGNLNRNVIFGYNMNWGNNSDVIEDNIVIGGQSRVVGSDNVIIGRSHELASNVGTPSSGNIMLGDDLALVAGNNQIAVGTKPHYTITGMMGSRGTPTANNDVSGEAITITGTSALPGSTTNLDAGDLVLQGGAATTTGTGVGGDVVIKGGAKGSTGAEGAVYIKNGVDTTLLYIHPRDYNIHIGDGALSPTMLGTMNICMGYNAGTEMTVGGANVLIGESAGSKVSSGAENIGIGYETMGHYSASNVTGDGNIGIGKWAGATLDSGNQNTCIGDQSGEYLDTGDNNTFVGAHAANIKESGIGNTFFGAYSGEGHTSGDYVTLLGFEAGSNGAAADYSVGIGYRALHATEGINNIGIGRNAGDNITTGTENIIIGSDALSSAVSATDSHQLVLGTALQGYMSALTDADYSSKSLILSGPSALAAAVTNLNGGDLELIGGDAATTGAGVGGDVIIKMGAKGSTGTDGITKFTQSDDTLILSVDGAYGDLDGKSLYMEWNVGAIGIFEGALGAPGSRPAGYNNVGIGWQSGWKITTGEYNIGLGMQTNGGDSAVNLTGSGNIAIGDYAQANIGGPADGNIGIGDSANSNVTTGINNIAIGDTGGWRTSTGSGNISIGSGASPPDAVTSNYITIGAQQNYPVIYGYMPFGTDVDASGYSMTIVGTSAWANAATNLSGGDLILQGGLAATTGAGVGGDVIIKGGVGGSTGTAGAVKIEKGIIQGAVFNIQTGTTYTIQASDNGLIIGFNNASSIAVTLPDTLDDDFHCTIIQLGVGVPTVTRSGTDTINGVATGVTPAAQWAAMYLAQFAAGEFVAVV